MPSIQPLRTQTLVITAGSVTNPGTIRISLAGYTFVVYAASSSFQVQFDSGATFDCIAGAIIPVSNGFQTVTFYNPRATPVSVTVAIGAPGINFIPSTAVRTQSTRFVGWGQQALANNGSITFPGVNNGNQRKSIVITNLDAALNLQLLDANGAQFAVVFAGTPWAIESDGLLTIRNQSGASINYVVGESYYNS